MKKGQKIIVTHGEYSDYGIADSFVVLRDFSFDKALAAWLKEHCPPTDGIVYFGYGSADSEQAFLQSLRAGGFVADEPLNEVHLSDYGRPTENPAEDAEDDK